MAEKKKKLGDSIRDVINPALEDPRRKELQEQLLDKLFDGLADEFGARLEKKFQHFFNDVAAKEQRKPGSQNLTVIEAITMVGSADGETRYSPVARYQLPISTQFTQFSARDICELEGYIKLHTKAREMDVAVKLVGLTTEESRGTGAFSLPPVLIIDATRTYDEGAMENASLYPTLPPQEGSFDDRSSKKFEF